MRKHSTRMLRIFAELLVIIPMLGYASERSMKIAIIKADDIRGVHPGWEKFFRTSKEHGVKVSGGVICSSLQNGDEAYVMWLRDWQSTGMVEFWNHGWDHKRWGPKGKRQIKEFRGSGYDHQKRHVEDSQNLMKKALERAPAAFGAPYNAMDSDTSRVLRENEDLQAVFCYSDRGLGGKIPMPMAIRGEGDGTGKPNFEKFKLAYEEKRGVVLTAIQFHPANFGSDQLGEYVRIIDFLKAEGWTFMLPSEYVALARNR